MAGARGGQPPHSGQGAALEPGAGLGRARHSYRPGSDGCLRRGRASNRGIAARRAPVDDSGRVPARQPRAARSPAGLNRAMPRYKLTIEYDGQPFVGWQIQDNGPSVQGALTAAAERFCGETVSIHGAGRTDAGVHALGQVCHLDLRKNWDEDTVRDALNRHLRPHLVAVTSAERVSASFDARFSAIKRHYLYRIINRRADLTFERGRAWRIAKPLDIPAMQAAAQRLVGRHDFTTFRNVECQAKSPVKTLDQLDVHRRADDVRVI